MVAMPPRTMPLFVKWILSLAYIQGIALFSALCVSSENQESLAKKRA